MLCERFDQVLGRFRSEVLRHLQTKSEIEAAAKAEWLVEVMHRELVSRDEQRPLLHHKPVDSQEIDHASALKGSQPCPSATADV